MSGGTIVKGAHLIIGPLEARYLETILPLARAEYRRNGSPLPAVLSDLFTKIEVTAKCVEALIESSPAARETVWIRTSEAAELLGVSERRVRALGECLTRKKVLGAWRFDRADVLAEAEARTAE